MSLTSATIPPPLPSAPYTATFPPPPSTPYTAIYTPINEIQCRLRLKCDGTRAEPRFRLSGKRMSQFKSVGGVSSVDYWQPRCAHQLLLLVVKLDTPCSEVVWRVLATHSIRQLPIHFPSRTSLCAITFQLESSTNIYNMVTICVSACVEMCQAVGIISHWNLQFIHCGDICCHWVRQVPVGVLRHLLFV